MSEVVKTKEMIQFLDELHYGAQDYDFELVGPLWDLEWR